MGWIGTLQTPLTFASLKDEHSQIVFILQWKCRLLLCYETETIIVLIAMILDFTTSSYQNPVASSMASTDEGIIVIS